MSSFSISEEMEFSTRQIAEMTGIKQERVANLIANPENRIPHSRTKTKEDGTGGGHIRVKLKDFDAIMKADRFTRAVGGDKTRRDVRTLVNAKQIQTLIERCDAFEQRIDFLEKAFDHYTAPEVVPSGETR